MSTVTRQGRAGDDAGRNRADELLKGRAGTALGGHAGAHSHRRGSWHAEVAVGEHTVTRKAAYRSRRGTVTAIPEEVIWPTWPATTEQEAAVHGAPLEDLHKYWSTAGDRLRESAKWMATVLGAAMATVIGTSPLARLTSHHLQLTAALVGAAGLIFLGITMLLVLRVMRPQAVSYADIEAAAPPHGLARILYKRLRRHWRHSYVLTSPLYRWRRAIETHQDLYQGRGKVVQ